MEKILRYANLSGAKLGGADLSGADLIGAKLSGADLFGADLREANLSGADLSGAELGRANLWGANLRSVNLSGADLSGADLSGADLSGADLREVNLSGAKLRGANLWGANLKDAKLTDADLTDANLREANLFEAYLNGADLDRTVFQDAAFYALQCPEEGAFIGWKKGMSIDHMEHCIIKLLIPEDAKRSSATSRKCRCNKAKVLEIYASSGRKMLAASSLYNPNFFYRVGETVEVQGFNEDRWQECSTGIHFFITRREAEEYSWRRSEMKIVKANDVPIYELVCHECKSVIRYKACEVTFCHITCPVCGISLWANTVWPVTYESSKVSGTNNMRHHLIEKAYSRQKHGLV